MTHINVIESPHNLERDILGKHELDASHRVHCRTCKVGPMSLDEARAHAAGPRPLWGKRDTTTYRLFTIFP